MLLNKIDTQPIIGVICQRAQKIKQISLKWHIEINFLKAQNPFLKIQRFADYWTDLHKKTSLI